MSEGEGNQQTQSQTQRSNRGGSRGGQRRGRGGRGRGNGARGGRNVPSQRDALEPASAESASAPGNSDAPRGRRNRRGQPRGAHGPEARGSTQTGPQRRFGGHLTSHADEATSSVTSEPPALSAHASEFIPGATVTPRR